MPIDTERLQKITSGKKDFQKKLLDMYFQTFDQYIIAMDDCSDDNDQNWFNSLHSIKGATDNLGMTILADLCRDIELARPLTPQQKHEYVAKIKAANVDILEYSNLVLK